MAARGGGGRGIRRARQEEGHHYENEEVDRISFLPDELAHHVLSFLPEEDVARTSVLSRRWKSIWRTLPSIDYDETRFEHLNIFQCRLEFLYSMCRFFLSGDVDLALIQNIRVFAVYPRDDGLELFLNLFIDMAISKSKLLQLSITIDNDHSDMYEDSTSITYSLPDRVFESGKYLTSLFLKSCSCGPCENVKFPSLKTMCLIYVLIPDEMLENLISNSPMLEDLKLLYCFDMEALRVFNSTLRHLVVGSRDDLALLEMDVPNLCVFTYHGILPFPPDLNADDDDEEIHTSKIVQFSSPNKGGFKSLKTMNLAHVTMKEHTLRAMLSTFRFIDTARLHSCIFEDLPFTVNPRLEYLEMEDCKYDRLIVNYEILKFFSMKNYNLQTLLNSLPEMQFNNLKVLELIGNVNFNAGSLVLTHGPCLEIVIVRSCFLLKDITVAIQSLKSLTVQSCFCLEEAAINAPNLKIFNYHGFLLDLSELIVPDDVIVELCLIQEPDLVHFMENQYEQMLWNFYRKFEFTRHMSIEGEETETIIVPGRIGFNPAIRYLSEFIVKTALPGNMTFVSFLLEVLNQAFCFRSLTIDLGLLIHMKLKFAVPPNMAQLTSDRSMVPVYRHDCIRQHLVRVEITNFHGNDFDMELAYFLLGHAKYLNSLIISFSGQLPPDAISRATIAVIRIPKANPFATVEFKYG